MTVREGELNVIAVSCLAIGISSIHYRWEKYHLFNNSWISPSHRAVNIVSPNLIFSVIIEEDKGFYRCVVTNNDGSVISDNATVHVYGDHELCAASSKPYDFTCIMYRPSQYYLHQEPHCVSRRKQSQFSLYCNQ